MSDKKTKLFVANLSSKVDKKDLEEEFDRYGKVRDVNIREGKGGDFFAFVEFDEPEDAEEACDNSTDKIGLAC